MKKLIIVAIPFLLLGCSNNNIISDISSVDCIGTMYIQAHNKRQDIRLKKYDSVNDKYYAVGSRVLSYPTWFDAREFEKIICLGGE